MKDTLYSLCGIFLFAILFTACDGDDESRPQQASLMFVNGWNGSSGGIDCMVNQTKLRTGSADAGSTIGYNQVYTGNWPLSFVSKGGNATQPLASVNADFAAGKYYTCFIGGSEGAAQMLFTEDDLSSPDSLNRAKIRFINLSPSFESVDLAIKDSTSIFTGQQYMKISGFTQIDTAAHTLIVRTSGTNGTEVASLGFHAAAGRIYSFYLWGTSSANSGGTLSWKELTAAK